MAGIPPHPGPPSKLDLASLPLEVSASASGCGLGEGEEAAAFFTRGKGALRQTEGVLASSLPLLTGRRQLPLPKGRVGVRGTYLIVVGWIVRRLARDRDVMRMAFAQAGIRDLDEFGFLMQIGYRARAGIAHRRPQAADELMQHG